MKRALKYDPKLRLKKKIPSDLKSRRDFPEYQCLFLLEQIYFMNISRRKHLKGANLIGAKLQGAECHKANLIKTSHEGADLHKANFLKADLQKANPKRANLTGIHHLSIEQLSKVKTLYEAKLDEEIPRLLKENYPALFQESEE